jgi:hypothetical protein
MRPGSWSRLVTITRQPGVPGSRGRTWSASRALSSRNNTRRSARTLRYNAVCAAELAAACSTSTRKHAPTRPSRRNGAHHLWEFDARTELGVNPTGRWLTALSCRITDHAVEVEIW